MKGYQMDNFVVINFFQKIEDPRIDRNKLYPLCEILLVAFATILSGGETYVDMKDFGTAKLDFFKTLLPFENGVASEDTFERVFNILHPSKLEGIFTELAEYLQKETEYKSIAIDGKTLRRSRAEDRRPLHIVSAWASHNKLILGCKAVEDKSNEITAIPEVLKLLSLKGATVTTDAMGCQTEIAQQIIDQKGDFALAVKENHANLHDDLKTFFDVETKANNPQIINHTTLDKDHGRLEKREFGLCSKITWLIGRNPQWNMVKSIGFVTSTRITKTKNTTETRYFIVSYKNDIARFAQDVRHHWSIENSLHWVLDVTFHEDYSRVRNKNAATNLAIIRRLAISKYEKDATPKRSKRRKRLLAGWDDQYLKTLLIS